MGQVGIEGFDHWRSGDPSPFNAAFSPNNVHTGSATRFNYGQAVSFTLSGLADWNVNSQDTVIQAVGLFNANTSGTDDIFVLYEGGNASTNIQVHAVIDSANRQVNVYRGSGTTNLIASTAVNDLPPASTWHHVGWEVLIHASAGYVKLWIDGVLIINSTGLNTKARTNAFVTVARLNVAQAFRVDDYLLFDGQNTGDGCHTWPGNCRIYTPMPVSDSAVQFTPNTGTVNAENVDDAGDVDGDTTYNASSTAGHKDLLNLDNAAIPVTATIKAVELRTILRKDDAAARTARGIVKSGSTIINGATRNPGTSYTHYRDTLGAIDTSDSNPWTPAKINSGALKIGYENVS
jgi:hypothetical protein